MRKCNYQTGVLYAINKPLPYLACVLRARINHRCVFSIGLLVEVYLRYYLQEWW